MKSQNEIAQIPDVIVSQYLDLEEALSEVLFVIPFVEKNKEAWSPKLISIICEACNQLDSLWKFQALKSPYVKNQKLGIKDYFHYFGQYIAAKRVIFWGYNTEVISPYNEWVKVKSFDKAEYISLNWWHTYTDFKHNRYENYLDASLEKAILSLAGLFTAILNCEYCYESIVKSNWVSSSEYNSLACLGSIRNSSPNDYLHWCVVESKLFAYPVGFDNISSNPHFKNEPNWIWEGPASPRFIMWFNYYGYFQWIK
jgi:hypothetical protein